MSLEVLELLVEVDLLFFVPFFEQENLLLGLLGLLLVILILLKIVVVLLLGLLNFLLKVLDDHAVGGPLLTKHINLLLQSLILCHCLIVLGDGQVDLLLLRFDHDLNLLLVILPWIFEILDLLVLVLELPLHHGIRLLDTEESPK